MINYEGSQIFARDGTVVDLEIRYDGGTLTGKDLRSAWTFDQAICAEESLRFGSFGVGKFTVSMANEGPEMLGRPIDLYLRVTGQEPFHLGKMTVKSETLSADRKLRELVARDDLERVINANMVEWYNAILPDMETSVTLQEFRNSFFQYFGIRQEEVQLINDQMIVRRTIDTDEISGKKLLRDILEPNGCFGLISQGVFKYVFLGNPEVQYNRYYGTTDEGFVSDLITKLQIRTTENDIGAVVGEGQNCYIMQDNMLLYGMSQAELTAVAENMYSVISTVQYTPATLKVKGNPCIECGDGYSVVSKRGTFTSYVLQRSLTGRRSLKDTFTANGTKVYTEKLNATNRSIVKLRMKTNELIREVDRLESNITNIEENTSSRFMQTDEAIETEVRRASGREGELESSIQQTAEQFDVQIQKIYSELDGSISLFRTTEPPTLYNYPAMNFNAEPKLDGTWVLGVRSTFIYTDEGYRKWSRSVVYDETTGISYRFRNINGAWGWEVIADAEYSLLMQQISELRIEADGIAARVEENYTDIEHLGEVTATIRSQVVQNANSITSEVTRATKAEGELGSRITQTAESITSEIKRATDAEGTLNSRITQTANSITAEITRATAAEGNLSTKITQTAENITAEVSRATKAEGNLSASIKINADGLVAEIKRASGVEGNLQTSINANASSISAEVSRATREEDLLKASLRITDSSISSEVSRATKAEGDLSTRIMQTETSISSKVSRGSIISEINQSAESVTISAAKINLQGLVTSTEFTSKFATITELDGVNAKFENLNASNIKTGKLSVSRMDVDGLVSSSKFTSKFASITSLESVEAKVKRIESNYITADYINVNNITAALKSPTSGSIAIGSVATSEFRYYSGSGYESFYPVNVTINGKVYRLFGRI